MASSTMMSRPIGPARPSDAVSPKLFCANTYPSLRAHVLAHPGEQVILGSATLHERADQLVLLGGPDLALDLQRGPEPGAVRIDLGGMRPQRIVANLEPVSALHPSGDPVVLARPLGDPLE